MWPLGFQKDEVNHFMSRYQMETEIDRTLHNETRTNCMGSKHQISEKIRDSQFNGTEPLTFTTAWVP